MIEIVLEGATNKELYNIAVNDDDLSIQYEATRQLQGRQLRGKARHRAYWNSFKNWKE